MTYIIIVTYNGIRWLKSCLDGCKAYNVIVVDNASSDGTVDFIETHYTNVTLLRQSVNLGFGQANNIGISYALDQGASRVFLLNQDAYLINDVLNDLVAFQLEHPDYGILSPIHITADMKRLDKSFFKYMLRESTGQFFSDFVLNRDKADVYNIPFVNAAAWLISRQCIETIGGFDPIFFHYGEDDNYCQRAIYHGFKIGVLPNTFVIHDRDDQKLKKADIFNPEYFKNKERIYKILYANINLENTIEPQIKKIRKIILKLRLRMKFKQAALYKRELFLLLEIRALIDKSRAINKLKGRHYL